MWARMMELPFDTASPCVDRTLAYPAGRLAHLISGHLDAWSAAFLFSFCEG
ncbi:hypothetical protein TM5383_03242 [Thalassovita mediterranea]|uniref:Uncharacterized protein n=1 Tax=Thalassovita mediterranea TaxID=340021 RepID=A0A0P1GTK8_9RHOB|nr:hypothetical protein TM5383_03242 [Thalassovita mediterranea]SIS34703.1 hypothetical protein SAMN05421685_11274 [Thalassovita mediterranea]